RTFSGFWTFPVFIAAGATGLAGGRGRSNTRCCLIGCLMLSSLAAIFGFASYADILWLLAYLLETVVIASRAVCCRFPPADSKRWSPAAPWRCSWRLGETAPPTPQDWQQLNVGGGQLRNAELLQLELEMEIEATFCFQ
uniref:MFS domain-containing protein n=1 Tax=Macrostomum lignano TaxID=282301 RepID=A0A1I8FCS4_9PLAT